MRRRRKSAAPVSLFAFQDIVTSVTGVVLLVAMAMAIRVADAPTRESTGVDAEAYGALETRLASLTARGDEARAELKELEERLGEASTEAAVYTEADALSLADELTRLRGRAAAAEREADRASDALSSQQNDAERLALGQQVDTLAEQVAAAERRLDRLRQSRQILFNTPPESAGEVVLIELFRDQARTAPAGEQNRGDAFRGGGWERRLLVRVRQAKKRTRWVVFAHPGSTELLGEVRSAIERRGDALGFDLLPDGVFVITPSQGDPGP